MLIPVYNDQAGLARSRPCAATVRRSTSWWSTTAAVCPVCLPEGLPFQATLLRLAQPGIVGALNTGLEHIAAAGHYDYVARLDAGDRSLPGRMAAQMAFLDAHPEHAMVGCWTMHVDPAGRFLIDFQPPAAHRQVIRFLRYRTALVHTSIMLRRRALEEIGFYRAPFAGAEDLKLYLRLARRYKLANLERTYAVREITPDSITSRRQRIVRCRLRVLAHHFDARSLHTYLGLASNLVFLLLPRAGVLRQRQLAGRVSRARAARRP